jgi:lysine 2,3-aminomutase
MTKVTYINDLARVEGLPIGDRDALQPVSGRFKFRTNDYYLSLIDWNNPADPIRRIIIPDVAELDSFGELDASDEDANYVAPGCQHKYPHTAVLLCNEVCGGYCRFCFRKRLFMEENNEAVNDVSEGIAYIRDNPQITNVLLTGGDPLLMSTRKLENIIRPLRDIGHVQIIRIGSKMLAFNPHRIIDDPELPAMLARYSTRRKRIYVMTHFNVVEEITDSTALAADLLVKAGVVLSNQSPILRGINDRPTALKDLMQRLSFIGIPPYYFFQCRPTVGNMSFVVPLVEAYEILEKAKCEVSGLAKRVRLVMSHSRGKIEIVAVTESHIYAKIHRARFPEDEGLFMVFHRDNDAYWLDDLVPSEEPHESVIRSVHKPVYGIGPE